MKKLINLFIDTFKNFGMLLNSNFNLKNSNIIKSFKEIEFIITKLKNEENIKDKIISLKLLFQATKDGQNGSDFHNKCDGIPQQLIFIKTQKGKLFGGYTKVGFNSRESYIIDNKAFVFSIPKKKIYDIENNKYAIYDYKERGPCFVGSNRFVINILSRMREDYANTCPIKESYYKGFTTDYELSDGECSFKIQEIEVY